MIKISAGGIEVALIYEQVDEVVQFRQRCSHKRESGNGFD